MEVDYGEIEAVLEKITGKPVGFETLVEEALAGESLFSLGKWIGLFGNAMTEQLRFHSQKIGYLLVLILSAAVLSVIAKAFRNRQISDMGFYMIFLLLSLILMRSFGVCYELTSSVIGDMIDFMKVLMPAYLMAAAASAYRTSAVVYYEGFLLMIYYLQKVVASVLMPGIRCYVLLSMLSYLGKEDFFSRGRETLKKMILWGLKLLIGIAGGLQMIQGMISPAIDEMKHTVFSKGISGLGTVGNVAQNVTDVILGSGALLKNGIGVAGAICILLICLLPVVQVSGYAVFYQLLSAAAEPISDKRLVGVIEKMGEGIGLLVKVLFTVCAMFLLSISIICVTTGGIR